MFFFSLSKLVFPEKLLSQTGSGNQEQGKHCPSGRKGTFPRSSTTGLVITVRNLEQSLIFLSIRSIVVRVPIQNYFQTCPDPNLRRKFSCPISPTDNELNRQFASPGTNTGIFTSNEILWFSKIIFETGSGLKRLPGE